MIIEQGTSILTLGKIFIIMWPEAIVAFFVQKYIGGPLSLQILPFVMPKKTKNNFLKVATRGFCTVLIMAPCMTLIVALMHHGFSAKLPLFWVENLARNLFFALTLQIFIAGPLVRTSFRAIFRLN